MDLGVINLYSLSKKKKNVSRAPDKKEEEKKKTFEGSWVSE